jgi:zinc protease
MIEEEPQQTATRYVHIKQAGYPPLVRLNFKGPAFSNTKDLAALNLLNMVLFAESGELYQKLVLKEQKVRSLTAGVNGNRDPNLIVINASLRNASDMQYVKDELIKALDAAKSVPLDSVKLAQSKRRTKYSIAMAMDNPEAIANTIAQAVWLSGDPEGLNKYYAVFETITTQDVMNAAKKYFTAETLTISTISPSAENPVK